MSEEKIVDVFEHWLQGRINLSVSGLVSRLDEMEKLNAVLLERIAELKERMTAMDAEQPNKLNKDAINDMITDGVDEYFDKINLVDHLDSYSVWDLIEDKVTSKISDVLSEDSSVEDAIISWCDNNLEERVKDIVTDELTFEVTVS